MRRTHAANQAIDPHHFARLAPVPALKGTRWLVVDTDATCADALACALRDQGAQARLVDLAGGGLRRLQGWDAQLVLADARARLDPLRRELAIEPSLRWASLLPVDWQQLWPDFAEAPALGVLGELAHPLLKADRTLHELALGAAPAFSAPLDQIGPVRILRAVQDAPDVFRVRFDSGQLAAYVEMANGLVLNAVAKQRGGAGSAFGQQAMRRILELRDGKASVQRRARPEGLSLVMPLEQALAESSKQARQHRSVRVQAAADLAEPPQAVITGDTVVRSGRVRKRVTTALDGALGTKVRHSPTAWLLATLAVLGLFGLGYAMARWPMRYATPAPRAAQSSPVPPPVQPPAAASPAPLKTAADPKPQKQSGTPALVPVALGTTPAASGPRALPAADKSAASRADARVASEAAEPGLSDLKPPADPTPGAPPHGTPWERSRKLAKRAASTSDAAEAQAMFEEALALDPNNPHALVGRARGLVASKQDLPRALQLAERAVQLRRRRAEYRLVYGDALWAAGDPRAARRQYRVARTLRPNSRQVRERLRR